MADKPAVGHKRRRLEQQDDVLESVRRGETVEATLAQKLTEYVERIDTDMVRDHSLPVWHACSTAALRKCLFSAAGARQQFLLCTGC